MSDANKRLPLAEEITRYQKQESVKEQVTAAILFFALVAGIIWGLPLLASLYK